MSQISMLKSENNKLAGDIQSMANQGQSSTSEIKRLKNKLKDNQSKIEELESRPARERIIEKRIVEPAPVSSTSNPKNQSYDGSNSNGNSDNTVCRSFTFNPVQTEMR